MDPGERIDIWVIEAALGEGGMGSVYRCHNADAERIKAAIKVLDDRLRKSQEAKARFVREAEILFRLNHPNIVQVRNVRMNTNPPYLEMEFVVGESLEDRIRRGPMPLRETIERMTELIEALVYLHDRGIRHRDIKPDNLLVCDEGLKLVDFGLAIETDATRITQSGVGFGTVSYVPPEWMDPDTLDPVQWDLYATGVVFWELLRGEHAYSLSGEGSQRNQLMQLMLRKQTSEPLDPGKNFPMDVRLLIQSLTRVDPADRPSSAKAVRDRLGDIRRELEKRGWERNDAEDTEPITERREKPPVPRPVTVPGFELEPQPTNWVPRVLGALGLIAGGLGLWIATTGTEVDATVSRTPIAVTVTGAPAELPIDVEIARTAPVATEGSQYSFAIPAGETELSWAAGEGCAARACAEGECGAWCGYGTKAVQVPEGETPHLIDLEIVVPKPNVTFQMPKLRETQTRVFKKKYDVRLRLGDRPAGILEGWRAGILEVLPGKYDLLVEIGECEDEHEGCWPGGGCPVGCSSLREEVVIPWQSDSVLRDLQVPVPREG